MAAEAALKALAASLGAAQAPHRLAGAGRRTAMRAAAPVEDVGALIGGRFPESPQFKLDSAGLWDREH